MAEWTYFRLNVDCNMLNNVCKRCLSIKIKHLQINHEYQTVTWNKRVFLWARPSYWVDTGVVYYLHGKTGRFTVWTNFGLINFVEESRLPFVQISFIPIEKRPRRRETGVEDGFENGTRISVWNIPFGKTGLPCQMFRCHRTFSAGKTQKVVFLQY